MNTRLGLSAKTPSTEPQVHFSWPGNWLNGLGQSLTTSYGPGRSQPPTSPGTAAKPAPARPCPRTGHRLASKNPIGTPKAIATSGKPALRISSLRSYVSHRRSQHLGNRERSLLLALYVSIDLPRSSVIWPRLNPALCWGCFMYAEWPLAL